MFRGFHNITAACYPEHSLKKLLERAEIFCKADENANVIDSSVAGVGAELYKRAEEWLGEGACRAFYLLSGFQSNLLFIGSSDG